MKALIPAILLLAAGCTATRPVGSLVLGGGGALIGHELSGGEPAMAALGAAGGIIANEAIHYLSDRQSARAYASGYDKGRSDAVKAQYWMYVNMQRDRAGQVRLYPVHLPEQWIDGVRIKASTRYLRIEE